MEKLKLKKRTKERIFYIVALVLSFLSFFFKDKKVDYYWGNLYDDKLALPLVFARAAQVLLVVAIVLAILSIVRAESIKRIKSKKWFMRLELGSVVLAAALSIVYTSIRSCVGFFSFCTMVSPCLLTCFACFMAFPVLKRKSVKAAPVMNRYDYEKSRASHQRSIREKLFLVFVAIFCLAILAVGVFVFIEYVSFAPIERIYYYTYKDSVESDFYSSEKFRVITEKDDDYYGHVGDTLKFEACGEDEKNYLIKLSTKDDDIVEVDGNVVYLKAPGKAKIKVKRGFTTEEIEVVVYDCNDFEIEMLYDHIDVYSNSYSCVGFYGSIPYSADIEFKSSNESIATVEYDKEHTTNLRYCSYEEWCQTNTLSATNDEIRCAGLIKITANVDRGSCYFEVYLEGQVIGRVPIVID